MAQVKVQTGPDGIELYIGGTRVKECTGFTIEAPIDGVVTLDTSMYVEHGSHFEFDGEVKIFVRPLTERCRVEIAEKRVDGQVKTTVDVFPE